MRKGTLVRFDYDNLPELTKNLIGENPFKDIIFIYISKIRKMKGHVYLQDISSGKPYILDKDKLRIIDKKNIV